MYLLRIQDMAITVLQEIDCSSMYVFLASIQSTTVVFWMMHIVSDQKIIILVLLDRPLSKSNFYFFLGITITCSLDGNILGQHRLSIFWMKPIFLSEFCQLNLEGQRI